MIRGLDTTVKRLRRKVFEEVARLGFEANDETLCDDMEAIPYAMVNEESPVYRDSIYRARAVVRERLRLAMGLSLRPENKPVHLTAGVEASNISDKYYEPPLMQVIPSACAACEERKELPYHKMLLNGELPYTIGGGIGQSRLCMLLLDRAHVGEVQASIWPEEMKKTCKEHNIVLL